MWEEINRRRRSFLGAAAMTIAAAKLTGSATAQPGKTDDAAFAPLKQIDAGVLSIGYAEAGPAGGPPVILLHGWPYDIQSYVDVAPLLASAGYRVIVPYVRGCGTTRFLSDATFRNGQQAAVATRYHRHDGRSQDRQGGHRRLRLGRTDGRYHRRALAGALQGPGRRKRLPYRRPGSRTRCLCRRRRNTSGGTSSISPPSAVPSATTNTGAISPSSSGRSLRRSGSSMTRRSIAPRRRSTIRITLRS